MLSRYIKRIFDILLGIAALIILSPLFIVIYLSVLLKLGRPVFFKQDRPGKNCRTFYLFKFRSMTNKTDSNGKLLPNEQRLTPFGKFLRSTSLDELPSLINVIRGELSFVGPRPLRTHYLPYYSAEQIKRHEILPGITGWAQVNGRNLLNWEQKLAMDVWYVEHRSFWLDLKILFLTIKKVFMRQGITPAETEFGIPFDEYVKSQKVNDERKLPIPAKI